MNAVALSREPQRFIVVVPIRTQNETNGSRQEHWGSRKKRVDTQHRIVNLCLNARSTKCPFPPPMIVTVTRLSRGRVDTTNLGSTLKHVIDAVARWIGIDDRHDHLVEYRMLQRKAKGFGVEIAIEPRV